jgi:predicted RNA-binding Zn ribbon-like protein
MQEPSVAFRAPVNDDPHRVQLAVDLVNSYALDPTVREPEYLGGPGDLAAILRHHGLAWPQALGEAEVAAARRLRSRLRRVFEHPDRHERVRTLNSLVRGAGVRFELDDDGVRSAIVGSGTSFERWLGVEATVGLSSFLAAYGFDRLGICEGSPCRDVYADSSFNRSRRYCSDRCANRVHAAAHRRRHVSRSS